MKADNEGHFLRVDMAKWGYQTEIMSLSLSDS